MSGTLACPSIDGCGGRIEASALCATPSGRLFMADYEVHCAMEYVLRFVRATVGPLPDEQTTRLSVGLALLRHEGTFRGYQCPSCGYAPLWHGECADLRTHQGQRVGEHAIDNRCPRCGRLFADVKELRTWDGRFDDDALRA
jgi:hypothetical protein